MYMYGLLTHFPDSILSLKRTSPTTSRDTLPIYARYIQNQKIHGGACYPGFNNSLVNTINTSLLLRDVSQFDISIMRISNPSRFSDVRNSLRELNYKLNYKLNEYVETNVSRREFYAQHRTA